MSTQMQSRGKKALLNTSVAMLQEIVGIICAFVIPRLILKTYGSTYNGLISSITQFLSCAVLLRAGIGGATRATLYKPLAQNDKGKINAIMSATNQFMKRIAVILAALIIIVACIYPLLVSNEFEWFFTFSLFVVIGLSTFAESMFGITPLILLQADQQLYIASIFQIVSYLLNVIFSAVLITRGCSIHLVKLVSAIAFVINPIGLHFYVKKRYAVDYHVTPDKNLVSQRWDAFFHQIAAFIMNNSDIIVLTLFTNMLEVSVYSVYSLIDNGLKKLVMNFTNGLEAAFGNMIATNDDAALRKSFSMMQFVIFSIATVVYTTTALVILQFVSVYTAGINDVNYIRPAFAYILVIGQAFNCVRQPYQLLVQAAGHYKQTKNGAIIEPIVNIIVSIVLLLKFGIIGVAIGTFVAILFRTVQYAVYTSKNLLKGTFLSLVKGGVISVIEAIVAIFIYKVLPLAKAVNYFGWCLNALVACVITGIIVAVFSSIFYRDTFIGSFNKLVTLLKK